MIENKAIATRESYGNALVEIAKEHDDLVVLDADLAEAIKTVFLRKLILSDTLTVASRRRTWQE